MQGKTRIKHRYLQEFCKWHQRHLCAINMNCDTRRRNRVHFFGKAKIRRENTMKTTSEQDTGFCAECKTLRISQICSQNSTTGFDHRVQNALRVQNAVSWVSKFAVGAHFRGCVWLENIASVSEYAGVVWTGARFRGCSFSRVHRHRSRPTRWDFAPPKPRPQTVTRIVSRVSRRTHLTSLFSLSLSLSLSLVGANVGFIKSWGSLCRCSCSWYDWDNARLFSLEGHT